MRDKKFVIRRAKALAVKYDVKRQIILLNALMQGWSRNGTSLNTLTRAEREIDRLLRENTPADSVLTRALSELQHARRLFGKGQSDRLKRHLGNAHEWVKRAQRMI